MRNIFITGANRGIGLELVRQYSQQGDTRVFATARKPEEATELQNLALSHPERVVVIPLDVRDQELIDQSVRIVEEHTNHLDVLINNAAINPPRNFQTLEAIDVEGMLFMFEVNSVAPMMIVKAYRHLLSASRNGVLVNMSTQVASLNRKTSGGGYGYASSKAALNMITRALAGDLKGEGVTTIMLNPGWVQTDMGGSSAPLTVQESVEGIINVVDNLTPEDNGTFLNWNGEIHPW